MRAVQFNPGAASPKAFPAQTHPESWHKGWVDLARAGEGGAATADCA
jgi:hypothetical protein